MVQRPVGQHSFGHRAELKPVIAGFLVWLRKPDDTDSDGSELGRVDNFAVLNVVDLAVRDEIKIVARDRAGRRSRVSERAAIIEYGRLCDAILIRTQAEDDHARGADAVLYCDEAPAMPVKTIDS